MLGIERNKDPELPPEERNLAHIVLLKDREYGRAGRFPVFYNEETDQFLEPEDSPFEPDETPSQF